MGQPGCARCMAPAVTRPRHPGSRSWSHGRVAPCCNWLPDTVRRGGAPRGASRATSSTPSAAGRTPRARWAICREYLRSSIGARCRSAARSSTCSPATADDAPVRIDLWGDEVDRLTDLRGRRSALDGRPWREVEIRPGPGAAPQRPRSGPGRRAAGCRPSRGAGSSGTGIERRRAVRRHGVVAAVARRRAERGACTDLVPDRRDSSFSRRRVPTDPRPGHRPAGGRGRPRLRPSPRTWGVEPAATCRPAAPADRAAASPTPTRRSGRLPRHVADGPGTLQIVETRGMAAGGGARAPAIVGQVHATLPGAGYRIVHRRRGGGLRRPGSPTTPLRRQGVDLPIGLGPVVRTSDATGGHASWSRRSIVACGPARAAGLAVLAEADLTGRRRTTHRRARAASFGDAQRLFEDPRRPATYVVHHVSTASPGTTAW